MVQPYRSKGSSIHNLEANIDRHITLAPDHDSVSNVFFQGNWNIEGLIQLQQKYRDAGWVELMIHQTTGSKRPDGVDVYFRE